jgi:hypothetical protein
MNVSRFFTPRRMLSGALICFLLPAVAVSQNLPNKDQIRVKEQALAIPSGWPVQVKLNSSDRVHGRMGQITDQGFVVQAVTAGKIEERTIAFTDVKKISNGPPTSTKQKAGLVLLWAALGAEIGFLAAH